MQEDRAGSLILAGSAGYGCDWVGHRLRVTHFELFSGKTMIGLKNEHPLATSTPGRAGLSLRLFHYFRDYSFYCI